MKKIDKIVTILLFFLIITVHLYAYRMWLFSSGILTHGDWFVNFKEVSKTLFSLPYIWKPYFFGSVDFTPPFYLFQLVEGLLASLNVETAYIQRIIFMWPIAIATLVTSYFLIKDLTRHRISALIGSLVYAYNTYFIIIQTGHLTLMGGFAFAPLVLLLFKKTLEKNSYFYAILTGFASFLVSFYEFRSFYLLAILMGLYYLYFILVITSDKYFHVIKQTIIKSIIPLLLVFLFNLYWLISLVFMGRLTNNEVFDRGLFGKDFYNIIRSLTLFHPFWTGGEYFPFIVQPIPFYFFLIPIFAFIGLLLNKKNKYIIFYGILTLVGVFLTKQNNPPFSDVYLWLYLHVPGFNAFREASKFYFIIGLGYSVLIGSFIDWLWNHWTKNQWQMIGKYVLTFLAVGIFLINAKPLITGQIGTMFIPRTPPKDYITYKDFTFSHPEFYRTLWLPADSRWAVNTNNHPNIAIAGISPNRWFKFIENNVWKSWAESLVEFFNKPYAQQLLSLSSIKYVIVPVQDYANDDNFYRFWFKPRQYYVDSLDKIPYLKKIDIHTKNLTLYENVKYRPHLYLTNEKETLYKDIPYKTVDFKQIDPTQYVVELKNIRIPVFLNFSDTYHPDWKLKLKSINWLEAVYKKDYFLSDTSHFQNDASFNSFVIDPTKICQSNQACKKNNDGSYDIQLSLYFKSQSYMYIGCILSIISFFLCLIFLSYCIIRKKPRTHAQ